MKNRYYLITQDYEISRVKVVVELEDYVGYTYSNGRYADDFGMIAYLLKSEFLKKVVKDLGTNPEWSPDEIVYDTTRSIS